LPNHYIVKFRDRDVPRAATQGRVDELLALAPGSKARDVWKTFRGFYGEIPADQLEKIRRHPMVEYIEEDELIYEDLGTEFAAYTDLASYPPGTQSSPWWHLDRIDEDSYALDGSYAYDNSGNGVRIYIIDTGIRQTHNDFGSRADILYEADNWTPADTDCHGHGTQVASAAAGTTWGVAKDATLVGVRVNDCTLGANKGHIISGIEWVANNRIRPAVANLSYIANNNWFQSVSDAVEDLVDSGVMLTKSAGNKNVLACGASTMHDDPGFVVGALQLGSSDVKWSSSNHGSCVDVYAPGTAMRVAGISSDSDTDDVAGTSYSAGLAAGVAAAYLEDYPNDAPVVVHEALKWGATQTSVSGDVNVGRVLYANVPRLNSTFWSGPTTVKPSDSCSWEATAVGGRQPFTYTWSGVLSGTGKTKTGSVSSSGWLYLDLDDSSGQSASYQAYITVNSGAPSGCPE